MLRLMIAVDGSANAGRVLEVAGRLARQGGLVEAVLLNVDEGPGYPGALPPFDDTTTVSARRTAQETLLADALAEARAHGLERVVSQAASGTPASEIVRVAADRGAHMIVMGTRGMTPLGGLFLGSVAQRVVHLSEVPVLLVK
jgi:nucleotide-binding universal stress UspA family protein